jgi:hypothetical protein
MLKKETETETENVNDTAYWNTLIPNSRKKASASETTGICLI